MLAPTNERRALERDRDELPSHVTNHQRELDATPPENRERRERLERQIRRVEKRRAEIHAVDSRWRLIVVAARGEVEEVPSRQKPRSSS
jgi:hypothetical protein